MCVGVAIRLDFDDFDLESTSSGCTYDYFKIYDDEFDHNQPVATYCGTEIPPTTRINGHIMVVKFRTDSSIAARGFNATFRKS